MNQISTFMKRGRIGGRHSPMPVFLGFLPTEMFFQRLFRSPKEQCPVFPGRPFKSVHPSLIAIQPFLKRPILLCFAVSPMEACARLAKGFRKMCFGLRLQ